MKKIIFSISLFLIFLFSLINIKIYDYLEHSKIFYDGGTDISIFLDKNKAKGQFFEDEEILEKFNYIQKKYETYISRYIFTNENELNVYTTDMSMNQKIKIKKGNPPKNNSNEFLSNKFISQKSQSGVFNFFNNKYDIKIFGINNLGLIGSFDGYYHIGTTDSQKIKEITSYLNQSLGNTNIVGIYDQTDNIVTILDYMITDFKALSILIFISLIIFVFMIIKYAIKQSKKMILFNIHGYSFFKVINYYSKKIGKLLSICFLLSGFILGIYFFSMQKLYYLKDFIIFNVFFVLFLFIVSLTIMGLMYIVQIKFYNANKILNGFRPFSIITSLQFILKYSILTFLVFVFINLNENTLILNQKIQATKSWDKAQDMYQVVTKFTTNDLKKKRPIEKRAFYVYKDFNENMNGILADFSNYSNLFDDEYLFQANSDEESGYYHINGKSIIVNKNYLVENDIEVKNGERFLSKLVYDENTLNILVPKTLKNFEDKIYLNFLDDFYYKKVEVSNIYNEELNIPLNQTKKEDLKVNIIYINNNIKYFTYDSTIMEENQNQVIDPIVVVDAFNFDYSFYYSKLTNSCYFKSTNLNPMDDFRPYVLKHNMGSSYNKVKAIYNQRAVEIDKLKSEISLMKYIGMFLIILFLFSIYIFNIAYYEQYKYPIYIKRIFGYSMIKINKNILALSLILTTLILIPLSIAVYIKLFIIIFDIVCMIFFSEIIHQKNFNTVIKGAR